MSTNNSLKTTSKLKVVGSAVIGGDTNQQSGGLAVVLGGTGNTSSGLYAAVLGGDSNTAFGESSAILSGFNNQCSSLQSAVIAGKDNSITTSGDLCVIVGGFENEITAGSGNIIMGAACTASGDFAGAFGANNAVTKRASFVFGEGGIDINDADFVLGNANGGDPGVPGLMYNHFRVDGDTSDVHIGRHVDQANYAPSTNKLYLHTVNASNQSKAVSLSADPALTGDVNLVLPNSVGTSGQVLTTDGTGILSWASVGAPSWTVVTTNYVASSGELLLVDTSGGSITITLPPTPLLGDTVTFADAGGSFNTNNLTINGNGENILGSPTDLTHNVTNKPVSLTYYSLTRGWIYSLV